MKAESARSRSVPGGEITHRPIYEHEISPSGQGRSEAMPASLFQEFAQAGQRRLNDLAAGKPSEVFGAQYGVYTPPANRDVWPATKKHAYQASREDWGGGTYNPRTGQAVNFHKPDKHAVTVREQGQEPVAVPHHLSEMQFGEVMDQARRTYRKQLGRRKHFLGVFHDPDAGDVQIDPVVVTGDPSGKHREEVGELAARQIAAATHSVGGAYHFASGSGKWPPHIAEQK